MNLCLISCQAASYSASTALVLFFFYFPSLPPALVHFISGLAPRCHRAWSIIWLLPQHTHLTLLILQGQLRTHSSLLRRLQGRLPNDGRLCAISSQKVPRSHPHTHTQTLTQLLSPLWCPHHVWCERQQDCKGHENRRRSSSSVVLALAS